MQASNGIEVSTQHASELQEMLGLGPADSSMNDFSADPFNNLDLDTFTPPELPQDNSSESLSPGQTRDPAALVIQTSIESPHDGGQASDETANEDTPMSGIGAGPLPTGYGVQLPSNAGSTLTDFTKRRNWSQRVVEEIKDFLHILSPDCRIMYVSPSAKALTGYEPSELIGKLMTTFIHPDDSGMYIREFNGSIASGHPLRFFYRFRKLDDSYTIFESHGHPHFSADVADIGGSGHGVAFCRGFFMMSRPYPTKNAGMLDSFLEHKIENERLKKRIADLKREEQEDQQQQYMGGPGYGNQSNYNGIPHSASSASMTPIDQQGDYPYRRQSGSASGDSLYHQQQYQHRASGSYPASPVFNDYNGMPPPAKPLDNYALTQRNLDEALASSIPDSINDKMARYEGIDHLQGIEMLTGLRYREGERSKGISTGAKSPVLEHDHHDFPGLSARRGDSGTGKGSGSGQGPTGTGSGSDQRFSGSPGVFGDGDRKKKMKIADEFVCTDCGTLDSPEWRRGPTGPKQLCNACGLRWAKQEKRRMKLSGGGDSKVKKMSKSALGDDGQDMGGMDDDRKSQPPSATSPLFPRAIAQSSMAHSLPVLNTQMANEQSMDMDAMQRSGMSGIMSSTGPSSAQLPYSAASATPMDMMSPGMNSMSASGMPPAGGNIMGMNLGMMPQLHGQMQMQMSMQMNMAEQQQRGGNGGGTSGKKDVHRR